MLLYVAEFNSHFCFNGVAIILCAVKHQLQTPLTTVVKKRKVKVRSSFKILNMFEKIIFE